MLKASSAYVSTQVTTTSAGDVLVLLYDGALNFLSRAREKMEAKDYAAKGVLISKALDIINELDGSLNQEKGGDLADNLHKLYFWCSARLAYASMKMDLAALDDVVKILSGLRGAYAAIQEQPEIKALSRDMASKQRAESSMPMRTPLGLQHNAQTAGAPGLARTRNAYGLPAAPEAADAPLAPAPSAEPRTAIPAVQVAPQAHTPQADAPAGTAADSASQASGKAAFGSFGRVGAGANLYRKFAQPQA